MKTRHTQNPRFALFVKLFFCFVLFILFDLTASPQGSGMLAPLQATCTITTHDTSYTLTPNNAGYFPRVEGVHPNETVEITLQYPEANAGDNVAVSVLDGGTLNDGKWVKVISLDHNKAGAFVFQVSDQLGIFRLLATKGNDKKVVQVWVDRDHLIAQRSDSSHTDSISCPPCGNDTYRPICLPCLLAGSNYFDPYTSNVFHNVKDLEVWGGVGEIPLVAKRNGSSRSIVSNWRLDYYQMYFAGVNMVGQAIIDIDYPQGWFARFTESATDPGKWSPPPGVTMQLFQYGNQFFLQLANGHRHQFEKVVAGASTDFVLREIKDQFQNVYSFTYDTADRKKRITEPGGRYLEYTFSPASFIFDPLRVKTSDGRFANFVYDNFSDGIINHNRLREVIYGDGTKATYDYSQSAPGMPFSLQHAIDPRVIGKTPNMKYTYINSSTVGMIYQELNGKTGEVMATLDAASINKKVLYPNGRMQLINMPLSQRGNINTYTDGVGAITTYEYYDGGLGFLKTSTDALGRKTSYDMLTLYGNPLEITHPDGSKEKWTRDTLDQVLTHTDELGRITTYIRDTRHRVTRKNYPDGTFETFAYNSFSQVVSHQKQNGCTETTTYDGAGRKTGFTDCLDNVITYGYDAADRLNLVTDARGNITKYEYDERGLLTKMTNADNSTQTYTYDDFGNRLSNTNELGNTWTNTYDEFKRPKTMTDPLARTTTYSYDLPGGVCGCTHEKNRPTAITLPSSKKTAITYDVEWRKTSETNGAGTGDAATTSYQYDLVGNLVKTIDGRNNEWPMAYDNRNRLVSKSDPLGNTSQYTYDAVGNQLTMVRPDAGVTTTVYDNMNRQIQQTDPKAQVTKYTYDAEGNMKKLTDANNNKYSFTYDDLDRKTHMTYPDGSFEQYTYNSVSSLKTYTNRKGDVRTYTYDNRNRETLSDWSDATPDVATTFDAIGRVLSNTSIASALNYTYDAANQMLSETQQVAGTPAQTVRYTYNEDGLILYLYYPSGRAPGYHYTNRNQVLRVLGVSSPIAVYSYDANGNRIEKMLGHSQTTYTYDDANRALSVDNKKDVSSIAKYNYGYDNVNRRTYVQYDGSKGDVYSYDAIDQVTAVQYDVTNPDGIAGTPTRLVNYGLDPLGNRTTVTDNAAPTSYTTNNLNQYTDIGGNSVAYNTNGSLAALDGWIYTYDAQERMIKAEKGPTKVEFTYDGRNRCAKRTINGNPMLLYYDAWSLIEERDQAGALQTYYVHGATLDEILFKYDNTTFSYYLYDALGNITKLADGGGDVLEQYSYDVFGQTTIKNNAGVILSNSDFGNRFLFTGREYLQEIDLYDYRNRIYSSVLGRFWQSDPIRFESGDYNLYRYVSNNTTNSKDPFGLFDPTKPCQCVYICNLTNKENKQTVFNPENFIFRVNPDQAGNWRNPFLDLSGNTFTTPIGLMTVEYNCVKHFFNCPKGEKCPKSPFPIPIPIIVIGPGPNAPITIYVTTPCIK